MLKPRGAADVMHGIGARVDDGDHKARAIRRKRSRTRHVRVGTSLMGNSWLMANSRLTGG
ncbi:MAG: hypothetical protein Q7T93_06850 [Methylobacterium sp.]|nr:hypothetical protein [Methylobacterium sp.]